MLILPSERQQDGPRIIDARTSSATLENIKCHKLFSLIITEWV